MQSFMVVRAGNTVRISLTFEVSVKRVILQMRNLSPQRVRLSKLATRLTKLLLTGIPLARDRVAERWRSCNQTCDHQQLRRGVSAPDPVLRAQRLWHLHHIDQEHGGSGELQY